MTFDFICHGSGEAMYLVLNAVATFFNGKGAAKSGFGMLFNSVTTVGVAAIAYSLATNLQLMATLKRLTGLFFVVFLLNNISADVRIVDKITNSQSKVVANVPYVLASTISVSSQVGNFLAEKFDSLFAMPYSSKYTESGLVMSSKVLAQASKMQIPDPVLNQHMKQFVSECVIFNGITKGKFTMNDLNQSKDVWAYLKDRVSPRFGFRYGKEYLSCQQIANKIDAEWDSVLKKAPLAYGLAKDSKSKRVQIELRADIASSYAFLTKVSQDAGTIMRQNIMRNMIDAGALSSLERDDPQAAIQAYSAARAKTSQESSMKLIGMIGSGFLTPLKIVIEALFYGIFPIVAVIALLPGGLQVAKTYLIALFWIQSWAPLYAILNMVMTVYGRKTALSTLNACGTKGFIGLQAVGALGEASSSVVAAASSAIPYIPMLSYLIFKSGAGALTQLSTSMMMQANSAAGAAAEEGLTGRYSLSSTNFDTHQLHNTGGFRFDNNADVRAFGAVTTQGSSGELRTVHQNNIVDNIDPAISSIGGRVSLSETVSASCQSAADESHRHSISDSQSSQFSYSSALDKFKKIDDVRSNSLSVDNNATHTESSNKGSAISKLNAMNEQLANELGMSESSAKSMAASVKAGTPFSSIIGSGGSLSGEFRTSKDFHDKVSVAKNFMENNNYDETFRAAVDEAKTISERAGDSELKSLSTGVVADYKEAQQYSESSTNALAKEKHYRDMSQFVESNSSSHEANLNQDFGKYLQNKYGSDTPTVLLDSKLKTSEMKSFANDYIDKPIAQHLHNKNDIEQTYNDHAVKFNKDNVLKQQDDNNEKVVNLASDTGKLGKIETGLSKQVDANLKSAKGKLQEKSSEFIGRMDAEAQKYVDKLDGKK